MFEDMKSRFGVALLGFVVGCAIAEVFVHTRLLRDMSVILRDQHRMITAAVRREYAAAAAKEQSDNG